MVPGAVNEGDEINQTAGGNIRAPGYDRERTMPRPRGAHEAVIRVGPRGRRGRRPSSSSGGRVARRSGSRSSMNAEGGSADQHVYDVTVRALVSHEVAGLSWTARYGRLTRDGSRTWTRAHYITTWNGGNVGPHSQGAHGHPSFPRRRTRRPWIRDRSASTIVWTLAGRATGAQVSRSAERRADSVPSRQRRLGQVRPSFALIVEVKSLRTVTRANPCGLSDRMTLTITVSE